MCDFVVDFLRCVKFHGQFTEGVTNNTKLSIAKYCNKEASWWDVSK